MLNLLKGSSLSKLSCEILKISLFARGMPTQNQLGESGANDNQVTSKSQRRYDNLMNFLISLDFLVKGLMSHWQIRLNEQPANRGKSSALMKGLDIKFPILIGDQYHTIAYYIVSRMGNIELTRILTVIEENFQKIFYNVEDFTSNFEQNLRLIYQQFYNYLPTFFAHGFKGVALIIDLGQQNILKAFDLGVELGYFF